MLGGAGGLLGSGIAVNTPNSLRPFFCISIFTSPLDMAYKWIFKNKDSTAIKNDKIINAKKTYNNNRELST